MAQESARPNLMTFAQGTLPIAIPSGEKKLKVGPTQAIAAIDGRQSGYIVTTKPATEQDVVEFDFSLSAATQFEAFEVPNVLETPSPSQTFFREIELLGSIDGADGPFVPLASAVLSTHAAKGEITELTMAAEQPWVKWVRLRLQGGIDVQRDKSYLEFSEIIGTGQQKEPEFSTAFSGKWKGRGVKLELQQEGATVIGCYDGRSKLEGTVDGNVLRALGADDAGVPSQFILIATPEGGMSGLRSTNGAPFKQYDGAATSGDMTCLVPEKPTIGCGSIVHGIAFDYDSAAIRASSAVVLKDLYEGLSAQTTGRIEIIGHSSSEGSSEYNRDLSARRAKSVADRLASMGINASLLAASGRGEDEPIASNDDEAGRSLNRRVEIQCTG
ncbi:MAG: OmpA family protein [Pseudomonadota bacterium]